MKPWLLGLLLASLTLGAYAQVRNHAYLNYDDDNYIVENMAVHEGLTLGSLSWADATTPDGLRIPVTWFSYWVDSQLWDLAPGAVLLTNVFYHTLSGLLLFWALVAATGARYRSAFVVAVFLLHPIHAESVAWASERKDVLCALLWNATLAAYVQFAKRPSAWRYGLVLVGHALALGAKPMAVSLPAVLLLFDLWPLHRLGEGRFEWTRVRRALLEKLPLVALSGVAMVVAYGAQVGDGTMRDLQTIPLLDRLGNACLSYMSYIDKTLWPTSLTVFYPYREEIGVDALLVAIGLLAMTLAMLRLLWRAPYLSVGWLWYLGTLVPVIGLVQVGQQAMANRYAYLPLVGLSIALAWGADAVARRFDVRKWLAGVAAMATLAMTFLSWHEVAHWKNGVALFQHALAADPSNVTARANLGIALLRAGELDAGTEAMTQAFGIQTRGAGARASVRDLLLSHAKSAMRERNPSFAVALLRPALVLAPNSIPVNGEMGRALFLQRRYDEAIEHFVRARYSDDKLAEFHGRAAEALEGRGRAQEAVAHYEKAAQRAERAIAKHDAHGVTSEARALRLQRREWTTRIEALER
jgi:tetratricopeptide (TPR) repeat protein